MGQQKQLLRTREIVRPPGDPPVTVWAGSILLEAFPWHFGWVLVEEGEDVGDLIIVDRANASTHKRFKAGTWNQVKYGLD